VGDRLKAEKPAYPSTTDAFANQRIGTPQKRPFSVRSLCLCGVVSLPFVAVGMLMI